MQKPARRFALFRNDPNETGGLDGHLFCRIEAGRANKTAFYLLKQEEKAQIKGTNSKACDLHESRV